MKLREILSFGQKLEKSWLVTASDKVFASRGPHCTVSCLFTFRKAAAHAGCPSTAIWCSTLSFATYRGRIVRPTADVRMLSFTPFPSDQRPAGEAITTTIFEVTTLKRQDLPVPHQDRTSVPQPRHPTLKGVAPEDHQVGFALRIAEGFLWRPPILQRCEAS